MRVRSATRVWGRGAAGVGAGGLGGLAGRPGGQACGGWRSSAGGQQEVGAGMTASPRNFAQSHAPFRSFATPRLPSMPLELFPGLWEASPRERDLLERSVSFPEHECKTLDTSQRVS
jgi:hypothetical protein